ncbi:MAG: Hsp20/alpha crystallin family protein [Saprospiraceae bacterium]|nr:Hsp20/alpha crystallin family protein [Saprospiraceae bacterium]
MTLVKFKPFAPSQYVFGDLFEELFNNFLKDETGITSVRSAKPAVNILEEQDRYVLELAVPGIKKEDIDIKIEDKQLIISSSKETKDEETKENFIRMEYNFESFKRVFSLPDTVNSNEINAEYTDGILKLNLKKKEEAVKKGPVTIEIK